MESIEGAYIRIGWKTCPGCEGPVKHWQISGLDPEGNPNHMNCLFRRQMQEQRARVETLQSQTGEEA